MRTYQISIKDVGRILTPFQADSIFGHLCWVVAHKKGDKALKEFIEPFRKGVPPFIISDGFPGPLMPKPLSAESIINKPKERKEWKKIDFLSVDDFNAIRLGEKCERRIVETHITISTTPHNTISRLRNTTLAEGGVYSLKEMDIRDISIYLKATSDEWKDHIIQLFQELSKSGYGRKKSIGKGQFSINAVEEFEFPQIEKGDGYVSLSNFCPAEDDPTEGLYKTLVKYGKLGEEFTFCGNPFKKPLVMIRSGSVFRTDGKPKEFYGRAVTEGIAPAKPEVVQYAYAFAVPIKYPQIPGNVRDTEGRSTSLSRLV